MAFAWRSLTASRLCVRRFDFSYVQLPGSGGRHNLLSRPALKERDNHLRPSVDRCVRRSVTYRAPLSLRDNFHRAVIPTQSGAKGRNLALSVFKAVRDSSSPAAPRNDTGLRVVTQTLRGLDPPEPALPPTAHAVGYFLAPLRGFRSTKCRYFSAYGGRGWRVVKSSGVATFAAP